MPDIEKPDMGVSPKAFISYSWTSPSHQSAIIEIAKRLIGDGVEVVLDVFDLKEGDDKYVYMERMVVDPSVTHVLMFCDRMYADKANERRAGVGSESQIISKEIYASTKQSKFIPIIFEKDAEGREYVPVFVSSRIYIDFSTVEAVNSNWEQLLRVLHNKPAHQRPPLGKIPAFLLEEGAPHDPAQNKLSTLRQAILNGKPTVKLCRDEFLDAVVEFVDKFRIRTEPVEDDLAHRLYSDITKLRVARNHIVDWVLLESSSAHSSSFEDVLHNFLERLLELTEKPEELRQWNDNWFDGIKLFVYDVLLYIVAALLKSEDHGTLNVLLTRHYLTQKKYRSPQMSTITEFYPDGQILQSVLAEPNSTLYSPAGEMLKRLADRKDISFYQIVESDLLILFMSFINPNFHWYPHTLVYSRDVPSPFFLRATQHRGFEKLAKVTGIRSVEEMRQKALASIKESRIGKSEGLWMRSLSFTEIYKINELNTLT